MSLHLQEISILVDRSGSMQGRKELFARQALEHFVRSCPFQALVDIIGWGPQGGSSWADLEDDLQLIEVPKVQASLDGLQHGWASMASARPPKKVLLSHLLKV